MKSHARDAVYELLKVGDLEGLLRKAGEIHGHFCPGVSFGVKAGYLGMKKLGMLENLGMEELLAIVECNNCFVDGIQITTGCSFGNNAMIYKDFGKTAVTLIDRAEKRGVRIALRPGSWEAGRDNPQAREAQELFDKVVKQRAGTPEDAERMAKLWKERSFATLDRDDDVLFIVRDIEGESEIPEYAPIFDSQLCHACEEDAMETRSVFVEGKPTCIQCAGADYFMVTGRGVHPAVGESNR
jgi:formylmethanofuran dehydrogenase subunit E